MMIDYFYTLIGSLIIIEHYTAVSCPAQSTRKVVNKAVVCVCNAGTIIHSHNPWGITIVDPILYSTLAYESL